LHRIMRRATYTTVILLMAAFATAVAVNAAARRSRFIPPRVVYAGDIAYPPRSVAAGLVTFSVSLDSSGHAGNIQTIRDVPSLTAPAFVAVTGWTFQPAEFEGKSVASLLPVDILFNPGNVAFNRVPHVAAAPVAYGDAQAYVPPQVESCVYAPFPAKVLVGGPVVLDVLVSKSGRVQHAAVIYNTPSLSRPAISAVKNWEFTPAQFHGKPVTADVVVAFVFRSVTITTPYGSVPAPGA
jgi:Gram-negative bacterial TonB protein C-terminal